MVTSNPYHQRYHGDVDDPKSYTTLWESPKERAELTMIVDMMRNDISIVAQWLL